jgi:hypothetical protein
MKFTILILNVSFAIIFFNIKFTKGLSNMEKWRMYGIKAKLHVIDEKMLKKLTEQIQLAEKIKNELEKQNLLKEKVELEKKKKLEELRNQIYIKYLVSRHNSTGILKDMISRMFW